MSDLSRAETLHASRYHAPESFERQHIFARQWILVGHESEVAEADQTLAECLAGFPIFVQRGRDGELRGFHNVCRHRAGPLVEDGRGRHSLLRCRYHGWTVRGRR